MTQDPDPSALRDMTLDQLADDPEAATLVDRFTGVDGDAAPLQVAAFQSYIDAE